MSAFTPVYSPAGRALEGWRLSQAAWRAIRHRGFTKTRTIREPGLPQEAFTPLLRAGCVSPTRRKKPLCRRVPSSRGRRGRTARRASGLLRGGGGPSFRGVMRIILMIPDAPPPRRSGIRERVSRRPREFHHPAPPPEARFRAASLPPWIAAETPRRAGRGNPEPGEDEAIVPASGRGCPILGEDPEVRRNDTPSPLFP